MCRGGRPDLAGPRLTAVTAPTLLIVGGLDTLVLDLNRDAQAHLQCETRSWSLVDLGLGLEEGMHGWPDS